MSEERRDQTQEEARRVLSPVRLAVLLLLGALFLVVGGSRADAAGAEPAVEPGPKLVSGTLAALDAGPELAGVGATVDGVVDPVLTATEPVLEPVVAPVVGPVVRPVVEPVIAPLRPALEQVAPPLAGLPVAELVAPVVAPAGPAEALAPAADTGTIEQATAATAAPDAGTADRPDAPADLAPATASGDRSAAPVHGSPVSRTAGSTSDGGTGSPAPYAVLLTAAVAVLLFTGGVAPRKDAAPLAPTFLPPVFPG